MERLSLVILSFKNEPGQGLIKPWFCLMERLIKAIKKGHKEGRNHDDKFLRLSAFSRMSPGVT
jgi:hypothetical protein